MSKKEILIIQDSVIQMIIGTILHHRKPWRIYVWILFISYFHLDVILQIQNQNKNKPRCKWNNKVVTSNKS